jgi:hypothetical protein
VEELVRMEEPESMNLLGMLLHGFLKKQMQTPQVRRRACRLRGDFGLQVGPMAVTLSFSPDSVVVKKGLSNRTRARIIGPMREVIPLVTGAGYVSSFIAWLEGRISIRGNPFALLSLLPVLMNRTRKSKPLPALPGGEP